MVAFPNAKINIGLNIIEKRKDGYHNLNSCFYPVRWEDVLEVIKAPISKFTSSGIPIPGALSDNLCLKVYELLQRDFDLSPVHIHLHKAIPIGAGLGGGSSDAAHTLKLLNDIFDLQLDNSALENYALQLGSDCPFFIRNQPLLAYGRGELFEEVNLDLEGKLIVMVHPLLHISTAEAYAGVQPLHPSYSLKDLLEKKPVADWKDYIVNDFERSLFQKYPEIGTLKKKLYDAGALFASMSGSGATVFGIFEKETEVKNWFPENYLIWKGIL